MKRKPIKKVKTLKDVERLAALTRKKRRQYYLHSCVKKYSRLNRKTKTVFIQHSILLSPIQSKHLNELINNYQYAIQTEL